MSIKQEYESGNITDEVSFSDRARRALESLGGNRVSLEANMKTLGELRGKIQVLRRYPGDFGLDVTNWADDGVTDAANVYVQDIYKVMALGRVHKEEKMDKAFRLAAANPDDKRLYINFLSGFALESPWAFAQVNNWIAYQHLSAGHQRLGAVPMDFPPTYLSPS